MQHLEKTKSICLAALLVSALPLAAQVSYVDATYGIGANTTLADGSELITTANDVAGDNVWRLRAFGSSLSIIEASGNSGAEDCPEIRTTISGLTAGLTYEVNVHFWDPNDYPNGEVWNIRAGFTSNPGANTLFVNPTDVPSLSGSTAAVLASLLTYSTAPTLFGPDGGRNMYAGLVGTAVADGNGQIQVYVDDLAALGGANNRTWYDGVSYAAVPEPSTLALVGFGVVGLMIRRRNS